MARPGSTLPALLVALAGACGGSEHRAAARPESEPAFESAVESSGEGSGEGSGACLPAEERGPILSPADAAGPLGVYATCAPYASLARGPYVALRRGRSSLDDEAWSRLQSRGRVLFLDDRNPDIEAFDVAPCCDQPGRSTSKCLHLFLSGKPDDVAAYAREVLSVLDLPSDACFPLYLHTHIPVE